MKSFDPLSFLTSFPFLSWRNKIPARFTIWVTWSEISARLINPIALHVHHTNELYMALMKCWECGRQISEQAEACPGCGAPQVERKVFQFAGGIIELNNMRRNLEKDGWQIERTVNKEYGLSGQLDENGVGISRVVEDIYCVRRVQ